MFDFTPLLSGEGLASLLTLTLMEIVLGIDNIVFISILSNRLPIEQQAKARTLGISLALIVRLILLSFISYIVHWNKPLFSIQNFDFSVRDLILFFGGLFLIYKGIIEIYDKLESEEEKAEQKGSGSLAKAIVQIILIDIVFSFDSILTAIGLVDDLIIMILAVIISMVIMLVFSSVISKFINENPTIKMLALAFLLLIGVLLVLEGFHQHVPKGYIYSAIAFSLFVEVLNLKAKKRKEPVKLKSTYSVKDEELVDSEK